MKIQKPMNYRRWLRLAKSLDPRKQRYVSDELRFRGVSPAVFYGWTPGRRAVVLAYSQNFKDWPPHQINAKADELQMSVPESLDTVSLRRLLEAERGRAEQLAKDKRRIMDEYLGVIRTLHDKAKAGMMLMHAAMQYKVLKHGPDLRLAGVPRIDIDRLMISVDPGMVHLNDNTLRLVAERLVDIIEDDMRKARVQVYDEKDDQTATWRFNGVGDIDVTEALVESAKEAVARPENEQVLADIASVMRAALPVDGGKRALGSHPQSMGKRHAAAKTKTPDKEEALRSVSKRAKTKPGSWRRPRRGRKKKS